MSTIQQQNHATSDRISNLPLNVTQQILECLPLKQAARTSVLSKYWRNKWASTSQLMLDKSFVTSICAKRIDEPSAILLAYIKAVNDILLSHVGPICKFVLYIPFWFREETDFSSWLRFVYDNGVKEIILEDDRRPTRNFPTCLFSFVRLTHLTLLNCNLSSLSPTHRGFPCLISLKFDTLYKRSFYKPNVLTNLIATCPLLERLHISAELSTGALTIRAPKLLNLLIKTHYHFFTGNFSFFIDLSLEETRAIEILSLHINCRTLQGSKSMTDFFSCLANVKKLSLKVFLFTDFAFPKMFSKSLTKLQVLELIELPMKCDSSISLTLCLLLSSPNLEQLHIEAMKREVELDDDQLNQFDDSCIFQCLKTVHLVGITGMSNELKLIKFLLACSSVLEELTIELGTEMGGAEEQANFFKELNQYRRASPNAKMIIKT